MENPIEAIKRRRRDKQLEKELAALDEPSDTSLNQSTVDTVQTEQTKRQKLADAVRLEKEKAQEKLKTVRQQLTATARQAGETVHTIAENARETIPVVANTVIDKAAQAHEERLRIEAERQVAPKPGVLKSVGTRLDNLGDKVLAGTPLGRVDSFVSGLAGEQDDKKLTVPKRAGKVVGAVFPSAARSAEEITGNALEAAYLHRQGNTAEAAKKVANAAIGAATEGYTISRHIKSKPKGR
jgi:hypothetical protein